MRIFSRETRQARGDLIAARQDLDAVEAALEETDEYLAANQAVIDAEKDLRWWQRADIEFGCYPPPGPGHVRGMRPVDTADNSPAARPVDDDTDVDG